MPSHHDTEAAKAPENLSYEEAVALLESIIDRIESGEAGLEESIKEYERGAALIKRCRSILDRAEQRIEQLDASSIASTGSSDRGEEAGFGQGDGSDLEEAPF